MNRRSLMQFLLAAALPVCPRFPEAAESWRRIGARRLRANEKALRFALSGPLRCVNRFRISAETQSVWIESVTLHAPGRVSVTQPVRRSLPPGRTLGFAATGGSILRPAGVSVALTYLPFGGAPARLELMGRIG